VLPAVVRQLEREHAGLSVELLLDDRHVDLVREGVDVALRITGEPPDSGMVYRRLAANRQVVCASPDYLERRGTPATPQDLASHECIAHLQRSTPRLWHFTTPTGGKVSVKINGRTAVTNALAVRACALQGLGIIELNSNNVGADVGAGRLVLLLDGCQPGELSISAVVPQRRFLAPKVRVFIDALLACMTPEPYWDAFLLAPGAASLPGSTEKARNPRATAAGAKSPPGYARRNPQGSRASRR